MTMQEFVRNPETGQEGWILVQRSPIELPKGAYAFKMDFPSVTGTENLHEKFCAALTKALLDPGSSQVRFIEEKQGCFVQFMPEGTLDWDSFSDPKAVDLQLVLIAMGGDRVSAWSHYVINSNTGTRLVFE